jgi:hypothetical protein
MTKINLEEIVQKFEEFHAYVAGINREELKGRFTREELKGFKEKIYNISSNRLEYEVNDIIKEKKLEEYPELLGVHHYPVLKEIDFMTEEEKIKLDEKLTGYRVGDYLNGLWRFTKKEKKLKQFLLDKGVARNIYYLNCRCEEQFLGEMLSGEEKVKLEEIMKKSPGEWSDEEEELYENEVQEYCCECYAGEDRGSVKQELENGKLFFKELLRMEMKRDDSLDKV